MNTPKWSQIHFVDSLPKDLSRSETVLIYDQVLSRKYAAWIKKFPQRMSVKSGENLKDVRNFPQHMQQLLRLSAGISRTRLTIVVFGGGSVGDFGGFAASVLKRGVKLVQIPSTWLAAMDSAHGGKTALNVGQIKNQMGTFYFPAKIYLVKKVLLQVPEAQVQDSLGEFYKTALISGGKLWQAAERQRAPKANFLWKNLPLVVQGKMRVVKKDPFEAKGLRHVLNLGHTVGHVLEAELGLAHGRAVHLGLLFSLRWGERLGFYQGTSFLSIFPEVQALQKSLRQVPRPSEKLQQDKKMASAAQIQFVFVKRPGKVLLKKVKMKDLLKEWQRQCL